MCSSVDGQPAAAVDAGLGAVAASMIESVKESTTCHYVLTFATPLLCKSDAFRQEAPAVSFIKCSPLSAEVLLSDEERARLEEQAAAEVLAEAQLRMSRMDHDEL